MDIQKKLFDLSDENYAKFQSKLVPNVDKTGFIGVRVPALRKVAKEFEKNSEVTGFLEELPHKYYDENMLHSIILQNGKDYDECIRLVENFLPYVDNWAVCDTLRPKCFAKHKSELITVIKKWISSDKTYTCRFGIDMLMTHYLDDDFKEEYLKIPAKVKNEEYYVKMMVAWFYATALAKQWDSAITYIENKKLSPWIHNKTIQKACESFRISEKQKNYLKEMRI